MNFNRNVVPLVGAGAVAAILATASGTHFGSHINRSAVRSQPAGVVEAAVRVAFQNAITLRQTMVVPETRNSITASNPGQPPNASERAQLVASAKSDVAQLFEGDAQAKEDSDLDNVSNALARPNLRVLAGGARDFQFQQVTITGDTAHVVALATTWSKVGTLLPDGSLSIATPTNVLQISATLDDGAGPWRVSTLDWNFAPGSEP